MPKLPPESGKIAIVLASGIASLACPALLPATGVAVIHALAPNIASDMITGLRYDRIREYFRPTHPDQLNHDLAKLLHASSIQALKNLEILYTEKVRDQYAGLLQGVGAEWVKQAKKEFKAFRTELEAVKLDKLDSEAFLRDIESANTDIASLLPAFPNPEIQTFVQQQIKPQVTLAFKEALKDPANERAWKAMQLWMLEETMTQNRSLLEGQSALKAQLDGLLQTPASRSIAFNQALENVLEEIQAGVGSLLAGQEAILKNQDRIIEAVIKQKEGIPQRIYKSKGNILGSDYPVPRQIYLDRVQLKRDLKENLEKYQWVNLFGSPGMGKTTFASDFFDSAKLEYEYVAWVNFSTDLPGSFVQSFYENDLDISQKSWELIRKVARFEAAKLRNLPGRVLIVINGIKNWAEITADLDLIHIDQAHFILISETPTVQDFIHKLEMPELSEDQIIGLFDRIAGLELKGGDISMLGGNMYLTDLVLKNAPKTNARDLKHFTEQIAPDLPAGNSVLDIATRLFNLSRLSNEAIWVLLQIAAISSPFLEADSLAEFLCDNPEEADPEEEISNFKGFQNFILDQGNKEYHSDATLIQQLNILEQYGWLTLKLEPIDNSIVSFTIHPISRELLKIQFEPAVEWFPELTENLKSGFFSDLLSPLKDNESYKSHLEHFIHFIVEEPVESYLSIVWKQIQLTDDLVLWTEKVHVEKKYHDLVREIDGDNSERLAEAKLRIGDGLRDLGKHEEAKNWLEQALETGKIVFGEESNNLWKYFDSLGLVLKDIGEFQLSKDYLEYALNLLYSQDVLNEVNIAVVQSNLGNVHRNLGDYKKARALLE
ncbi:MAG: tetratricopeptide repeat protein, partial [Saprospiraceae bacterium]|nr:tetratricopeptide repeat protein [Saprospiraceae bacterium]